MTDQICYWFGATIFVAGLAGIAIACWWFVLDWTARLLGLTAALVSLACHREVLRFLVLRGRDRKAEPTRCYSCMIIEQDRRAKMTPEERREEDRQATLAMMKPEFRDAVQPERT